MDWLKVEREKEKKKSTEANWPIEKKGIVYIN
jgi:hypothetical protein